MAQESHYRVLLIGIDAYNGCPLHGCVNDIDAVERLLLERAGIPAANITRLASPHPADKHETKVAGNPATLANIRAALTKLASDEVQPTDRVFIYYSGHGSRAPVKGPQGTFHCESLVPVDFNVNPAQPQLLLDFEFNRLLATVAKRTTSVVVVLDCCHSTGATRVLTQEKDPVARSLDFSKAFPAGATVLVEAAGGPAAEGERGAGGAGAGKAGVGSVDDCQVVAACLNDELAQETRGPDGVRHGLLTRALLTLLGPMDRDEIRSVPWARVWQKLRDSVETANPSQHLWLAGSYARAVLAGPPVDGDAGFAVKKTGANEYTIDAGTLADVSEGAKLAVYGDKPPLFPDLGSPEDRKARVSPALLKVVRAERARAVAQCEGPPFEVPAGARARLVELGPAQRLGCAVLPEDPKVVAALRESPLLQVVKESEALARLERRENGAWALTDDLAGAKPQYPALLTLKPDQLKYAREVLELYAVYSLPLRMAKRCTDLPGGLQVRFLVCSEDGVPEEEAQTKDLPEMTPDKALSYVTKVGTAFCIHVRNTTLKPLRVALVNCAASGRVEYLGDQIIDPRAYYRFWRNNVQGEPFVLTNGEEDHAFIERMVAIGTTAVAKDLKYLANNKTFADILDTTRGDRDMTKNVTTANAARPVEKWTATVVNVGVNLQDRGPQIA